MASDLKSYVEQFVLNPANSANLDNDEDDATIAQLSEQIKGPEGNEGAEVSASKLRMKNALTLSETDSRYKTKKVPRNALPSLEPIQDPELTKYLSYGEDSAESASDDDESDEASVSDSEDYRNALSNEGSTLFEDDGDFESEDPDNEDSDNEDEELGDDDEATDEESGEEFNASQPNSSIKTFHAEDTDQREKGQSVKNQLALFDSVFEARIVFQKALTAANRLPQHDTFKHFLKANNTLYKNSLSSTRASAKKLLTKLIELQEMLLMKNPVTEVDPESQSDEEIPSSDDEAKDPKFRKSKKRKVEEFEENLNKRHKSLHSYRDSTMMKWHEKVNILLSQQAKDRFKGFDVSPVQQMNNLLINREPLVKRTQLISISRGNAVRVFGKEELSQESVTDEYDPEIFDDGDFYSRLLEEVLKSKMSLSDNMTDVSRKWIQIQNMRKKAKKSVDTKASKGRKIRYEVMSKLQQYLAPSKPSSMDDGAMNMLFGSLFGSSHKS